MAVRTPTTPHSSIFGAIGAIACALGISRYLRCWAPILGKLLVNFRFQMAPNNLGAGARYVYTTVNLAVPTPTPAAPGPALHAPSRS